MTRKRWKPAPEVHAKVLFFTITLAADGAIKVHQIPGQLESASEEDMSLLMLHLSSKDAIGLHLTWLTGKPEPESPLRRKGLLAVVQHIHTLLPPDLQQALEGQFGIGHAYGAKVEWDKPES